MQRDWNNQHRIGKDNHHPLFEVQKALHLPETYTFGDTLDAIFMSILENLIVIHELNIAHRDCKCCHDTLHSIFFSRDHLIILSVPSNNHYSFRFALFPYSINTSK